MLRVDDHGVVNVPLVGNVKIGGMELTNAEAAIHDASIAREIYRNPQVAVAVQKRRSNKVTVLGAVNREGTFELPSNQSDLLAALVAAGGLAKDADTSLRFVRLRPVSRIAIAVATERTGRTRTSNVRQSRPATMIAARSTPGAAGRPLHQKPLDRYKSTLPAQTCEASITTWPTAAS